MKPKRFYCYTEDGEPKVLEEKPPGFASKDLKHEILTARLDLAEKLYEIYVESRKF